MKINVLYILLAAMVGISSCDLRNNTITGNGVKVTDTLGDASWKVEGIVVNALCNVEIYPSETTLVTVSGDENLLPMLEFSYSDNILNITQKEKTSFFTSFTSELGTVKIYMPMIRQLELAGVGSITTQAPIPGAGTVTVSNSGVGSIEAAFQTKSLIINQSGSGSISIAGTADHITARQSGVGNINVADIKALTGAFTLTGAGGIEADIADSVDASISGIGGITLSRQPVHLNKKVSGIGNIDIR